MHQTLVLACGEALLNSRQGFGNLFAQVDYLCKRHGIAMRERIAIQQMRRHSNSTKETHEGDWPYDVRALALFISAVFHADIPQPLLVLLPKQGQQAEGRAAVNLRYVRCVVNGWDDSHIYATTADGPLCINNTDGDLRQLLAQDMQLNLLDCTREGTSIDAGLIVVEPDFLIDISAIAACFQKYGHSAVGYVVNRLKPRANTQPILLGNFAGAALDDLIHREDASFANTLRNSFQQQALQFCTCPGFDAQRFKTDAAQQTVNLREAVGVLFADYDRQQALLEPSFVCEQLGLQGRVDLMTADMRLLVEQKSGKNWNIETHTANIHREDHYVQLLLYYGILRYNFHLPADRVDIRLLYSKYAARQGLLVVNYYQQLFRGAIAMRNRIVAQEIRMAREGFRSVMPLLQADTLLENPQKADFFNRYIRPEADRTLMPLHRLAPHEYEYVERMLTFVYREQLAQKTGVQEGQGGAVADLWNMPLAQKMDTGNIFVALTVVGKEMSSPASGYDLITLRLSDTAGDYLPNFRRGDGIYLYRYDGEPDVRSSILFKGVVERLTEQTVTVRLNDGQQNPHVFTDGTYAIEHGASDIMTTASIRSLHAFCTASQERRDLLLGRRTPRSHADRQLSRTYHPHYDDILLKVKQADDYFLLQGPPGTGKTSMALRFMVQEEMTTADSSILLMAYTNRAVDEICSMLESAALDYLRLGSAASCDPQYAGRLLDSVLGSQPRLDGIRRQVAATRIVVATTSTMLSRPFIFQLKRFSLAIIDEASQILEPNIIGLLASDAISRFVLVGDHKQLPAVVQQPDDEPRLHDCRLSLFERLLNVERQAGRTAFTGILRRQGRMHPDIAEFPNRMFYRREQLQCVPCPHQEEQQLGYTAEAQDALDEQLKQHRVLFFPSAPCASIDISDKVNADEARIVADLLQRLHRLMPAFDSRRSVGVIVPYRNQIAMIRREIEHLGIAALNDITIDTVERYQGSQRDVIIYSFTIQQPYQLDFLTSNCFEEDGQTIDRKLNVAMTRARKQLLMTGNTRILRQNALFSLLIDRYSAE